jgi:hypothetical protein
VSQQRKGKEDGKKEKGKKNATTQQGIIVRLKNMSAAFRAANPRTNPMLPSLT